MADERLGASFSIDVTNLKAGLAQANRLIKESESEFRAAAAGLDDWTQSEEGLNAKIKSLNATTEIQRAKVSALQTEYNQLIADGLDPASRAAVELRTKINNETAALNKNEAELKKQKEALEELENETDEAGDAADDMGDKFSGLKAVCGVAVGAIAAVGAACVTAVGAFLGLAESTREARENMAKIDTAFQTAGLSAENAQQTFTDLYSVMGDEGAAGEAAQQLAKISKDEEDLAANTRILTGVMAEYGASIPTEGLAEGMAATAAMGEVQGVLADALEWQGVNLEDYNAKLATLATEEERAAYIQETLTGLYGESADAYRENNAEIIASREAQARLNETLNELGAIAEPIMTTIKTLAADLLESITPFVSLVGEGLTGALNGTAGAADTFAEGLTGIVSTLASTVTGMLPSILDAIIAVVPQLLTALLAQLPTILTTIIEMVVQVINALSEMLPTIIAAIMQVLPQLINALIGAIPQLLQAAIKLLMAIVDALPTIITALIAALPSIVETTITVLLDMIPLLIDAAIELFMAIIDAIPVIIDAIFVNLPKIISAIIGGLIEAIPKLLAGAVKLLMAIVQAIPKLLPSLIAAIPQIITAIVSGLTSGISKIKTVGSDIIKGLWEGIKDMGSWIAKKIKGFGEDVLGGIKSFFGIKSPSRVMRDQVGKPIVQGLAEGVEDNARLAVAAIEETSAKMLESEKLYLAEKERIEKENAEKELAEKMATAKTAAEIEKLKQEEINKAAKAAQDAYLEELKAKAEAERKEYEAMLEAEKKAIEEIQKSRESVTDKLYKDSRNTFETVTFHFGDDGKIETYKLPDMKGQNKQLSTYSGLLDELFEKYGTLPKEVIENLASMTTEDGIKYVTAMLSASEEAWNEYVESFAERQDIAEKIGQALFPDAALSNVKETVAALSVELLSKLKTEVATSAGELAASLEPVKKIIADIVEATSDTKGGGVTVQQTNYFKQAYTSRKEQYKSKQQLAAAVRLVSAGAN